MNDNWIIDGISKVEMWCPVPHYEKLNIRYILSLLPSCIVSSSKATSRLSLYLEDRKRNNEKYEEFWSDTSNVIFNNDKTEYLCLKVTNIKSVEVE